MTSQPSSSGLLDGAVLEFALREELALELLAELQVRLSSGGELLLADDGGERRAPA